MSLADDLDAAQDHRKGTRCTVGTLLATLDETDAAALRKAIETRTSTTVGTVLRANGHDIGDDAVQRHRRRACRCL